MKVFFFLQLIDLFDENTLYVCFKVFASRYHEARRNSKSSRNRKADLIIIASRNRKADQIRTASQNHEADRISIASQNREAVQVRTTSRYCEVVEIYVSFTV